MHLSSVRPHRGPIRTPLRYPGGKTRLAGFFAFVLEQGGWEGLDYIEPYAGGAGAALSLLHDDLVSSVTINDRDICIYSFWRSVTDHGPALIEKLDRAPLDINEWQAQREIYRARDVSDPVALGFATFYLNRTNRSGVMNAGVIGGQKQSGKYKLDARYNKAELRQRLLWIASRNKQIRVSNLDGLELLTQVLPDESNFCYVDPPYFDKGSYLYMNAFAESDHVDLADLLRENRGGKWILTYDDVPAIRRLYPGLVQGTFSLPYSAHKAEVTKERMVFSDQVADTGLII